MDTTKKSNMASKMILGIVVLIVIFGALTGFIILTSKKSASETASTIPQVEVAADPAFEEVKGQLITGFPDFPVYPGATIVSSAKVKQNEDPAKGYRAEWEVQAESVTKVMQWYLQELKSKGWTILESPNDPESYGEQIASASKNGSIAYFVVELKEPGLIEIKVEIPLTNQ